MAHRILILGGTTEARELAARLKGAHEVVLSLAGRTRQPAPQPVPVRSGGFGGAEGLARHIEESRTTLLVDATHPFAARISQNAHDAAATSGVPLVALRRTAWRREPGDIWTEVDTIPAAVRALGETPRRVFVALGRQELGPLTGAPRHFYLVRSVDPVEPRLQLPAVEYILARGPFDMEDEAALLSTHRIDAILAKNSGGAATYGKIAAARSLRIPVFLVRRPAVPAAIVAETVEEAVEAVAHLAAPAEKRGE